MRTSNLHIPALTRMVLLVLPLLAASGCATGISPKSKALVDCTDAFTSLQSAPDRYVGRTVMLGGRIIATLNTEKATELVILQLPLSADGYPVESDNSEGRFRLLADGFLDPAIYAKGELVTAVGKITGDRIAPIGAMPYRYPVLQAIEIKKWSPQAYDRTQFHFGIGLGASF